MPTLTKRQKQILDYIKLYIENRGISPTFEEIKKHFKLSALSTVHQHIETLTEKGFLKKNGSSARGVELKDREGFQNFVEIPLVGMIVAGKPIEAIEVIGEHISLAQNEVGKFGQYYALKVKGDSMINEGIFDRDVVIIKKQSVAENGQTVVAIIDNNEVTLKKLYREKDIFRLQPANSKMLPIFRDEVEVCGIVVKIIRNFDMPKSKQKKYFRTLDLFAGVGGIRIGFEKAGFKTVFANDFEKACKITYDLNFKDAKLFVEDIKNIKNDDLPEFDFILGGFPCQAFSIAGYRKGFDDEKGRGNLFFEVARMIEARKPEGFLLENVKNLRGHDGGKTFQIIVKTLEDLGYHIKEKVLNSAEYGNVPQNRERIYIVGFKNKTYFEKFNFPEPVKLKTKITDILEKSVDKKYYYNGKPLFDRLKGFVTEKGKVYQWRRQYVRENKSGVCPTLTANMGTGGHNVPIILDSKGIRKLTPLECFRIQGFSKDYVLPKNLSDASLYKQAGNSVTVTVIEAVAKKMMEVML